MVGKKIIKEISDDLILLRLVDDKTKFFEGLWEIPEGVVYNSYLLRTKDGAVLIDGWKINYGKDHIEAIESVIDLSELKYVVINHMEPDHSGTIPSILEESPDVVVLGHPMVKNMFSSFYKLDFKFKPVEDGEKLNLGNKTLRFIYTPGVHWPETIMTYLEGEKILFTCDAFGSYFKVEEIYDDELSDDEFELYLKHMKKYFANIVGHYRTFAYKAIEKIESLGIDIKMIAPSHGLIVQKRVKEILELYKTLSRGLPTEENILVLYSSIYGLLDNVMEEVRKEIDSMGIKYDIMSFRDTKRAQISEIISKAYTSPGIILGVQTYEMRVFPLMNYVIDLIIEKVPPKPVLLISSCGWANAASNIVKKKLEDAKFDVVDVVEVRGSQIVKGDLRSALENFLLRVKALEKLP